MESMENEGLVFVRLFPGEDIYGKLTEVCGRHDVETAVVLSGLGQLRDFELGYFRAKGDYAPQRHAEAHELLSLSGVVSRVESGYESHLHATLAGPDKKAIGGHLIKGTVEVTNEIVLRKTNLEIKRVVEEDTGLKGMRLG